MSLIPAFKIAAWNAWVLILPFALTGFGLSFSIANRKAGLSHFLRYNKNEKALMTTVIAGEFTSGAYSIFLPLKPGTTWFYTGFPIYLIGMVFVTMTVVGFATSPVNNAVTKGIYRISRNPVYFGCFLIYIRIGVASSSCVFLLMTMGYITLMNILVGAEERMCLRSMDRLIGNIWIEPQGGQ